MPIAAVIEVALWGIIVKLTKTASIASLVIMVVTIPILIWQGVPGSFPGLGRPDHRPHRLAASREHPTHGFWQGAQGDDMNIDVAVIPAAGRGTRMRPATRVVPKALLTVVDRPAIQYAVEEAARAGAREAVVIVDLDVGHLVAQHFSLEGPLPGLGGDPPPPGRPGGAFGPGPRGE